MDLALMNLMDTGYPTVGVQGGTATATGTLTGALAPKAQKAEGTLLDAFLNSVSAFLCGGNQQSRKTHAASKSITKSKIFLFI